MQILSAVEDWLTGKPGIVGDNHFEEEMATLVPLISDCSQKFVDAYMLIFENNPCDSFILKIVSTAIKKRTSTKRRYITGINIAINWKPPPLFIFIFRIAHKAFLFVYSNVNSSQCTFLT